MSINYTVSNWNGFERLDFEFMGREALLIKPSKPDVGKHYMIKTEYFGAFPEAEIAMLHRGWHLAYIKNLNRWGVIEDQDTRAEFCKFLTEEFGLASKCIPVGMSCGGLHAVCFAARHPELISALYLDAPVMNMLSCPMGFGDAVFNQGMLDEVCAAYGVTPTDMLSFRMHPIDRMGVLMEHRIPVIMVAGDADDVVPYHENGALLEAAYRRHGLEIEVYIKPGCGHHPHGLADPSPIVNFMLSHAE